MGGPKHHYLFTSESVTEGHPDKICDQISDAVLDAVLREDSRGRVACEAMVKDQAVYVAGEITTSAKPDIDKLVRETVRGIGYNDPSGGFTPELCQVTVNLTKSQILKSHVAKPVSKSKAVKSSTKSKRPRRK